MRRSEDPPVEPHSGKNALLDCTRATNKHTPTQNTLKQLSNTPGLIKAVSVPGQFDIVALWQAKTPQDIMTSANEKLASLPGLFKSETLLTYAPFFRT